MGPCRHNSIKKKKKGRHSPQARLSCFYGQGSQLVVFKSGCLVGTSPPPGLAKGILIPPPSLLLAQDYRSLQILNKTAGCLDRNREKRRIPEKREWPGVAGNGVGFWEGAEGIKPKEETPPEQVQRSEQRQRSAWLKIGETTRVAPEDGRGVTHCARVSWERASGGKGSATHPVSAFASRA